MDVWTFRGKAPKRLPKNRDRDHSSGSSSGSGTSHGRESSGYSSKDLEDLEGFELRTATHEERLLAYLFRDYDSVARAALNTEVTVSVTIDFVLLRIHGLEERGQVLTTTGLVITEWTDDRLTWDPEKFGGVKDIIVRADKLWLPELAVMNGAEELVPDFERIRVLLNHEGRLHWEPGGIFRTTCDIDITYFPFDTQSCPILIGAYSYYSNKMNITNASSIISTHDFQQNGEWNIHATQASWNLTVLSCCPGKGYSHVMFILQLRRRYKFYMMNIVLPCLMLSALIMVGFFLPPEAGEKISLGISVLLAFTVFLLMIADTIPRTSLAIPLIVIYLMVTMVLGTISICMTVLVLNVHHRGARGSKPPGPWLRYLVLYHLAALFRIETNARRRRAVTSPTHEPVWTKRADLENELISKDTKLFPCTRVHLNGNARISASEINNKKLCPLDLRRSNGVVRDSSPSNTPITSISGKFKSDVFRSLLCKQSDDSCIKNNWVKTEEGKGGKEGEEGEEWRQVANVLDRLFFWIMCALMTSSTVFILLYPKYSGLEEIGE